MRQAQLLSKNMLQWGHATEFYCFLFQKSGTPKSWICHFCMICSQQTLGNDTVLLQYCASSHSLKSLNVYIWYNNYHLLNVVSKLDIFCTLGR